MIRIREIEKHFTNPVEMFHAIFMTAKKENVYGKPIGKTTIEYSNHF